MDASVRIQRRRDGTWAVNVRYLDGSHRTILPKAPYFLTRRGALMWADQAMENDRRETRSL